MTLRIGIWGAHDDSILDPLRACSDVRLVQSWSCHRQPALFWPRRLIKPFLIHADTLEQRLSSWPSRLLDRILAAARCSRTRGWLVVFALLLPFCWAGVALSQLLLAALRTLLAPLRGYDVLAQLVERHPAMLLSLEEQVLRADCDVWLVGPESGFPYPPAVKVVALAEAAAARLWAARIYPANDALLDVLRNVAAGEIPPDPLPSLLAQPLTDSAPHVHFFLPSAYQGGTWEAARSLLAGLVEINRGSRRLRLSLGVPPEQSLDGLSVRPDDLIVERTLPRLVDGCFVPFSASLLRATAWFALADRFSTPLLPARPYGMILHDVVHRFVPESYPLDFHQRLWPALYQTVRGAARVIATTEATRQDVLKAFQVPPERVALAPVACEPQRRFGDLAPRPSPIPGPFLLNPTNAAPHKGTEVMLEEYALLRRRRVCPRLVLCGNDTERFNPANVGPSTAYWARVRRLVSRLGLRVGEDVHFLGFVDDAELKILLQNASVVINAARHDNGTYALIEAHYFGKPTVSSRYPAAQELYARFGVPVRYFDTNSPGSLADALEAALNERPLAGMELEQARTALAVPELSLRRHAERVYALLVELATGASTLRRTA